MGCNSASHTYTPPPLCQQMISDAPVAVVKITFDEFSSEVKCLMFTGTIMMITYNVFLTITFLGKSVKKIYEYATSIPVQYSTQYSALGEN